MTQLTYTLRVRSYGMQNPNVTKLYKYRVFNEYSLSMLINSEMWVPKPEAFNDPFDCSLWPGAPKTTEDGMHQLFQVIDELYSPEKASTMKCEIAEDNRERPVIEVHDESLLDHMKEAENSGVFSLTEKNDNIQMWSHYAGEHKGFCIEFERKNVKENFLSHFMCRPVQYVNRYPNLHRVVNLMDVNIFTKAKGWSYEVEWRLVTKFGNMVFPLPAPITGIIFGIRASDRSIKTIANSLEGKDINFYQADRKLGEYAIEINKI